MEKINIGSESETERERQIASLDRIYIMLQRIGFDSQDIESAMSTTKASQLTDLLDWVSNIMPMLVYTAPVLDSDLAHT